MRFLYKKLASSHYGTTMWLQVKAFRDAIQSMIDNDETINNSTVWPIMVEILNSNKNHADIDGVPEAVLYNAMKDVRRGSYDEMDDFVAKYGRLYNRIISLRKNEDFVVNPKQMDKFLDLVQFFIVKSKEAGGDSTVDPNGFSPREYHGGVTATFVVFDIYGEEVPAFCKVLKNCSAVTIDCIGDSMVQISCTVPNVFVPKEELPTM